MRGLAITGGVFLGLALSLIIAGSIVAPPGSGDTDATWNGMFLELGGFLLGAIGLLFLIIAGTRRAVAASRTNEDTTPTHPTA